MKNHLFLNFFYTPQKQTTNKSVKKRVITKIYSNIIRLSTLQALTLRRAQNIQIAQTNFLFSGYSDFELFYLIKIKKVNFLTTSLLKKILFCNTYFLVRNKYFLSDVSFKNTSSSTFNKYSFIFYKFFFFFYNTINFMLLTNFNLTLFNRFKKTRRRFFSFLTQTKYLFINTTTTNLTNATNNNNKLNTLFYSYWSFLRMFFFSKKTSVKKLVNATKIILLILFNIVPVLQGSRVFLFTKPVFTVNSFEPKLYLNFFYNFSTGFKLRVKCFFSRRRRFRRFIFKKIKYVLNYTTVFFYKKIKFTELHIKTNLLCGDLNIFINPYLSFLSLESLHNQTTSTSLKLYKFKFRSAKRFSRKKKRNLRRRFFFVKRIKRHLMHRDLKKLRFKKTLLKTKHIINAKLTFINNTVKAFSFHKNFLLLFSTKTMLILSLLLLNKFRRFTPRILFLLKLFYNNYSKLHFNNFLRTFKKWSNVTPFFYLPKPVKLFIKAKKTRLNHQDYLLYLRQIMGGFFESLTSKKVFLKISTQLKIRKKTQNSLFFLYKKHRNYQNSIGRGFFFNEMLFVCWYSLFTKDLQFLLSWITRAMCRMEIRKHRKFIKILKVLFTKYKSFFLKTNKIKGFKLDIRGKLGVKGNAKKRHLSFNINTTSFSKKKYRLDYRQGLVYTETGVLGLTLILTY